MFKRIDRELKKLPNSFVVGIATSSKSYKKTNLDVLNFLVNKQYANGGYITANMPYTHLIDMFEKNCINIEKLHFIDCITKTTGAKLPKAKNCVFVNSPSHLTELSTALHGYITSSKGDDKFIHIDSLSTLRIHNRKRDVLRLVHYLSSKMKAFGLRGMVVSLNKETDKELIAELGHICDKIIYI